MFALLMCIAVAQAADTTVDDWSLSATISPLHLTTPIFEFTAEPKILDHLGLGVVGGIGVIKSVGAYELGVQPRWYPVGDFRTGLILGAELLWIHVRGRVGGVSGQGTGAAFGPMIGAKGIFDFGLTLDGQVGITFVGVSAKAQGRTRVASASGVAPLLNLNLGWSF